MKRFSALTRKRSFIAAGREGYGETLHSHKKPLHSPQYFSLYYYNYYIVNYNDSYTIVQQNRSAHTVLTTILNAIVKTFLHEIHVHDDLVAANVFPVNFYSTYTR